MSEPELLAYMTGTNDDFDLPRWHTQNPQDALSSSAQAAQSAAQASSYLYNQGPPPQSGVSVNRLPSIHQSPTNSSRQPRINQLLDEDQQFGISSLPYASNGGSLSRSTSLGGSGAARGRRHHMPDDLEGAFNVDTLSNQKSLSQGLNQQTAGSFYPSSVAYHQSSAQPPTNSSANNGTNSGLGLTDPYQDAYFPPSGGQPPKRSHTTHDASTSSRTPRSPQRGVNPPHALLDPYSPPQQNQYTPASSAYPYSPTAEQRSFPTSTYPSHSRSQSHSKAEALTPPMPPLPSAYSPSSGMQGSGVYSPPYHMNSNSPAQSSSQNLSVQHGGRLSVSQPPTPLSYGRTSQGSGQQYYSQDHQPMNIEPPPKRRASGLKRVRDPRDLRPYTTTQPMGRRMDTSGVYLSPLRQLTTNILETYHICNPQFRYESAHNPRRVLTKPSKPSHNDGYDNEDYDYILYVNDWLGTDEGHKYLILDILGQGTFGQVVKCQNMKTHEVVAVKVVKNKPAYFNQSMMEVTILELLNNQCDPQDEHHILRLRDSFIHKNHLCLVFELLSSNLYELIKQNQFQGLSTQLVKVFTAQLLDALTVLKEARLIHCDLKPENILLKSLQSPQIKVIDFGSACHERQTVYTYIQSRFYRSPEVLLGIPYNAAIDMWSLGCIAVELFLGLPLFPGTSEYNQITRIVEMLGLPPQYMLDTGKQTNQFFDSLSDHYGQKKHKLKSLEQYSREHNTNEQPGKQYFKATTLPDIINQAPMPSFKSSSRQAHEVEKEMNNRAAFIDFVQGLLNMNPFERWSPQQARLHPFITGEKWTKPWTPAGAQTPSSVSPSIPGNDPKRPYGGLVPSQPKGTRAYHDAAAYNQHLAQQQAYTAQAQAQAAQTVYKNPYLQTGQLQPQTSSSSTYSNSQDANYSSSNQRMPNQGHVGVNAGSGQYPPAGFTVPSQTQMNPTAPSSTYQSGQQSRTRSNTINHMASEVPPALARLQHMNQDVIGGRKALTPVLKRDDAIREWERRQQGKAAAAQPYPQLEYLQQQAEMAAAQGLVNWAYSGQGHGPSNRYQPPTSNLAHSYTSPMVVDDGRKDAVMSNVRSAARGDGSYGSSVANIISSPPQAYNSSSTTAGNRRGDMGQLYVPMQPDQYGTYNNPGPLTSSQSRPLVPPANAVPPSFYGAGVVPSGQQGRNPFSQGDGLPSPMSGKDPKRKSDPWSP